MTRQNTMPRMNIHRPSVRPPALILFFARLISWIFHPLFISCYVMGFLIFIHPSAFLGFDHRLKVFRFLNIFLCNVFLPGFTVFLLWRLKLFVDSIQLRTPKERIIPYLACMIFYWWSWNVFKNLPDSPPVAVKFLLGSFLAVCGAWFCNIYWKISMHAVAAGGASLFFTLFSFQDGYASGTYLAIPFLATGLICTSRFLISDHTPFEIWSGLIIGMLAMWAGWSF